MNEGEKVFYKGEPWIIDYFIEKDKVQIYSDSWCVSLTVNVSEIKELAL